MADDYDGLLEVGKLVVVMLELHAAAAVQEPLEIDRVFVLYDEDRHAS